MKHIALLRAINVGGNNKLPMADLVALFRDLHCTEVSSYIQSGNVVYRPPASEERGMGEAVAEEIFRRFGLRVPVVTRTAEEMNSLSQSNPFLVEGEDGSCLHVAFLKDFPSSSSVASLDPQRSPPDEFRVVGREVYLRFPAGVGRTRLTNEYLDSRLKTVSTLRNWRTVLTLRDMAGKP